MLHGDKGYDSDKVRRQIEARGAAPNIPPKINRKYKPGFSPVLYRNRNTKLQLVKLIAAWYDTITSAVDIFTPQECENDFAAAGYDCD